MTVFERIEFSPKEWQDELRGIITDLLDIRADEERTDECLSTIFSNWRGGKRGAVTEYNRELKLMRELIEVLSVDKQSYGYAYYWVGRALNVEARSELYHDIVRYANENAIIEALLKEKRENQGHESLPGQTSANQLPSELDTEEARIYFARAVDAGLMSEQYKWLETKSQLGYFCYKAYSQPRPQAALERFFDVKKLSSDITNAAFEPKRADVKKWRAKQDKEIFFD